MSALAKYNPVDYYGKTSAKKKEENRRRFIEDPNCRVIILNIVSGGTGLDGLQKVCSRVIFFESDWTPAGNDQAIARVERMGQTSPVLVDMLMALGGIEEYIFRKVIAKRKNINILMRS